MIKLLMAVFILVPTSAMASELKGIWLNHEGIRAFKEERGSDAHSYFAQSLAELPFSPEAHFNLGSTYFVNKEFDKALKEFDQAAKLAKRSGNKEAEFLSYFNSAISAAENKEVDIALEYYQRALEIKPDSLEVKTNIELLTRSQSGGQDDKDQKQKDQGDEGGQDQKQQPNQGPPQQRQKQQPKPFNSKEMSQQDVNRIVEELKRQEQQIRAKFQNDKMKSVPNERDW